MKTLNSNLSLASGTYFIKKNSVQITMTSIRLVTYNITTAITTPTMAVRYNYMRV